MRNYRLPMAMALVLATVPVGQTMAEAPQSVSAQRSSRPMPHDGLEMLLVVQDDCPFKLVETTHGIPDILKSGQLKNGGDKTIVSYRMGWVVLFHDPGRKFESAVGKVMNVPAGIKPRETIVLPAQGIQMSSIPEGARLVAFFVADVEFADGTHFVADVERIASQESKKVSAP
jgi:hypothetical protein